MGPSHYYSLGKYELGKEELLLVGASFKSKEDVKLLDGYLHLLLYREGILLSNIKLSENPLQINLLSKKELMVYYKEGDLEIVKLSKDGKLSIKSN